MSGKSGYIYVANWRRFQHYTNRRPPWIKLYNDLLEKDEYLGLSLADRGLLHDLWKLVSLAGDGRVSAERTSLARRLNVRRVSLDPLVEAGFIRIGASKAPATSEQDATPEGLLRNPQDARAANAANGAAHAGKKNRRRPRTPAEEIRDLYTDARKTMEPVDARNHVEGFFDMKYDAVISNVIDAYEQKGAA